MNEFIESGESGVAVADEWPMDFGAGAEKKAATVKQGFENAKNGKNAHPDAQYVKVLLNDEQVFLINLKAAGQVTETDNSEVAA
jgi:hypothetical protein